MNNSIEIINGLPIFRVLDEPIFKQFNISKLGAVNAATLIYDDGQMYMLEHDKMEGDYKWIEFTQLKLEGVELLKELIRTEFLRLEDEDFAGLSSRNILIWESFLDEQANHVQVASGSYASLPPVFKKIDDLINRFMYRMNEKIEINR